MKRNAQGASIGITLRLVRYLSHLGDQQRETLRYQATLKAIQSNVDDQRSALKNPRGPRGKGSMR
jgi:hypothetical protein